NLGGEIEGKESDLNQVRTRYAAERHVRTAGNLSVLDVVDVLEYSHDPRTQFMNWSSLTYGAWDFPADARGYTWGVAAEYITPRFQARAGRFLVPVESNGLRLEHSVVRRYGDVAEFELPYKLAGKLAVARVLVFRNRVNAGDYADAIALGRATAATPIKGSGWSRPEDTVGVAAYINGLSRPHRDYLAAGGLGFFLGDGRLNYAPEQILEVFYSLAVVKKAYLSLGYQRIANPGYN